MDYQKFNMTKGSPKVAWRCWVCSKSWLLATGDENVDVLGHGRTHLLYVIDDVDVLHGGGIVCRAYIHPVIVDGAELLRLGMPPGSVL